MLGQELKGRYKIISALSAGGFGKTYIAEDTQRPGSPKCVVKHLMPASNNSDFLEVARRLFNREAQILERLGRHDQIPQLLAYFEDNKEFYLVQDFIDGHTLAQELSAGKKMPESYAIGLLQDILKILEFVHSNGVIHRDIKPANIIRRKQDGKLVLIDFGAVKEIRTQLARPEAEIINSTITVVVGTGGYIAPEQALGYPKFSSDIYSLGMTAIQALTGTSPSRLPEDESTGNRIWQNLAQVNVGLATILNRMVYRNFPQRYQTVIEALEDLKNLANFMPPTVLTLPTVVVSPITTSPSSKNSFNIPTELQTKLEAFLGECIGPIAKVILKQAFNQASTPQEAIERLMIHIPVNRQNEFRKQAQSTLNASSQVNTASSAIPSSTQSSSSSSSIPASKLDPNFTRRCQEELSNLIGPMAAFICQRTLKQNSACSAKEFVEALAIQIPNQTQAVEFRRRLLS